jgi:GNAT superfamily N-acetyltransferase
MSNIRIEYINNEQQLSACAELLTQAYNAPPWNDNWTTAKALEKLTCFYNSPRHLGIMVYDGEVLLGCCVGNVEPYYTGDYFYLKEMFVPAAKQRNGTGAILMQALKEQLTAMGIGTIILFTGADFFPFTFYRKHGFDVMQGMCMMHYNS